MFSKLVIERPIFANVNLKKTPDVADYTPAAGGNSIAGSTASNSQTARMTVGGMKCVM
jgi:hypothetical protein